MKNLESGKPWTELDEQDLRDALKRKKTIAEIADFLCRTPGEIEERAHRISAVYLASA